MISSNIQELIRHFYCFEYIFFYQNKAIKFCWFRMFLFHDLYFKSYSLNVSDIYYSTIHLYIHYELLWQQHLFSRHLLFFAHYFLLRMNTVLALTQQVLQSQRLVSSFTFPVTLNYHSILTKLNNYWNLTYLYRFISISISYIKLSVSVNNNFHLFSFLFLM